MKIVTFSLGEEIYGLAIEKIQEIIMDPEITGVPNLPSFLKGIIKLRNQIIPVVEGVERLGYSREYSPEKGKGKIFIVEYEGQLIGIRVSEARQVLEIAEEEINSAPGMINQFGANFVNGVVQVKLDRNTVGAGRAEAGEESEGKEINILLLDLEKLFTGKEMQKIKKVREDRD